MNPSKENPSLLLKKIEIIHAQEIVDLHVQCDGLLSHKSSITSNKIKSDKELSPENLLKKLERQDKIGQKGEELLFEKLKKDLEVDENPKKYLIHTSKENAFAGYDIEYHFEDEHRYIEVKTTIQNVEADFFFSINEYEVLKAKGNEGFIYRVVLDDKLEKIIDVKEIQNPFASKDTNDFKAIAFKANVSDFEESDIE